MKSNPPGRARAFRSAVGAAAIVRRPTARASLLLSLWLPLLFQLLRQSTVTTCQP